MIDKEKVQKELRELYSDIDKCITSLIKARVDKNETAIANAHHRMETLLVATQQDVSYLLEHLQEKPVNENMEKTAKEWLLPQLDKSYENYGETKMMELTHFDGYAMLDAIEFGAFWQRNHVWHSTDEKPVHQSSCIVKYKLGIIDGKVRYSTTILKFNTVDEWFYVGSVFDSSCKSMPLNTTDIVCWAHVDELLPIEEK